MLPPEWWPQSAVMLTWPHAGGDWGDSLPRVERCFVEIAVAIAARQSLIISAFDTHHLKRIQQQLETASADFANIRCYIAASNDIWVRDHGPMTVFDNGESKLLNFQFNGWGGKYPAERDNALTQRLASQACFSTMQVHSLPQVIEGGGIEVNGQGCLLTTANCLTLDTRNPSLDETQLESYFSDWFNCPKVHWLRSGYLLGDDTDGHIDTLARFTASDTIVYQACQDPEDAHYSVLAAMAEELGTFRDQNGQPYQLEALPLPAPVYNAQGERLPAGYANFLIINDAILMPTYNDACDVQAATILQRCFPTREVIGIDCRALVEQFGSLHCATMQIPRLTA